MGISFTLTPPPLHQHHQPLVGTITISYDKQHREKAECIFVSDLLTLNSPFSNYKLLLNTNINDALIQGHPRHKVKYSQIPASECFKFENTR